AALDVQARRPAGFVRFLHEADSLPALVIRLAGYLGRLVRREDIFWGQAGRLERRPQPLVAVVLRRPLLQGDLVTVAEAAKVRLALNTVQVAPRLGDIVVRGVPAIIA